MLPNRNDEIMIKVDGVAIPCPSSFVYGLNDVSLSESGRTDDTIMQKNRVGQKVKIELSWNGKTWQETSQILQAFNPEYIEVYYPDMLTGQYETKTFYVGDRSAPVKIWFSGNRKIMETISFNIIER